MRGLGAGVGFSAKCRREASSRFSSEPGSSRSPKCIACVGHTATQAGSSPFSTRWMQNVHLSAKPSGWMKRAPYGQDARHALQPMHLVVIHEHDLAKLVDVAGAGRAAADARWPVAVVAALGCDREPEVGHRALERWLIQSRQKPSGTSFSVLQATTQSHATDALARVDDHSEARHGSGSLLDGHEVDVGAGTPISGSVA